MRKRPKLPRPERPWWRRPIQYLLRVRLRRRHVHGTFLHRVLGERLLAPALWIPSRHAAARALAIGVFTGLLPLPGLQIFFAMMLCYFFRANLALAALATFLSNPFTALPLLGAQYKFGLWVLAILPRADLVVGEYAPAPGMFSTYGKPLLVGSVTTAALGAMLAYPLMHGLWLMAEGMVRRRREARAALVADPGKRSSGR